MKPPSCKPPKKDGWDTRTGPQAGPGRFRSDFWANFSAEKASRQWHRDTGVCPHPRGDLTPRPCDTLGTESLKNELHHLGGSFSNTNNSSPIPRAGPSPGPPSSSCCPQGSGQPVAGGPDRAGPAALAALPLPRKSAPRSPAPGQRSRGSAGRRGPRPAPARPGAAAGPWAAAGKAGARSSSSRASPDSTGTSSG